MVDNGEGCIGEDLNEGSGLGQVGGGICRVDFGFCFQFIWLDKLWYLKGFIELELYLNLEEYVNFLLKKDVVILLKGLVESFEEVV